MRHPYPPRGEFFGRIRTSEPCTPIEHSLTLKVIAEGVETEEQAKFLRLLRCDEMQEYLLSRPLPLEGMRSFLERGATSPVVPPAGA